MGRSPTGKQPAASFPTLRQSRRPSTLSSARPRFLYEWEWIVISTAHRRFQKCPGILGASFQIVGHTSPQSCCARANCYLGGARLRDAESQGTVPLTRFQNWKREAID